MIARRSLVAGSAAAVAVTSTIPAWPTSAPHLDAQLLRLNAELSKAWARENHAWALAEGEDDDAGPYTSNAHAANSVAAAIVTQIENQAALTLDGLLVKLKAASWCASGDPVSVDSLNAGRPNPSQETRLLAGLLVNLSAMGRVVT